MNLSLPIDIPSYKWQNNLVQDNRMEIQRTSLRDLQQLQEDMAEYFCDEYGVSGETYWTCVESVAQVKLMEVTGKIKFNHDDLEKFKREYTEEN